MVAEVDYARYHSTGVTVVVDDGGDASAGARTPTTGRPQAGLPARPDPARGPEPAAAAGQRRQAVPDGIRRGDAVPPARGLPGLHRPEHRHAVGQGALREAGQLRRRRQRRSVRRLPERRPAATSTPTATASSTPTAPTAASPASSTTAITRAENDPRWAAAENWEPGVSDVRIQLWDENRTHLLNEATTDNWNNSAARGMPVAEQRVLRLPGTADRLLRRPAQLQPGASGAVRRRLRVQHDPRRQRDRPASATAATVRSRPSAGKYVVKMILPPATRCRRKRTRTSTSATVHPAAVLVAAIPAPRNATSVERSS